MLYDGCLIYVQLDSLCTFLNSEDFDTKQSNRSSKSEASTAKILKANLLKNRSLNLNSFDKKAKIVHVKLFFDFIW